MNILIQNGSVLTMDEANTIHTPGWVWVEGERVAEVGGGSPPADLAARAERVIDATHMAVLPGLVNGHTHLSQTFVRGLADDKPLLDLAEADHVAHPGGHHARGHAPGQPAGPGRKSALRRDGGGAASQDHPFPGARRRRRRGGQSRRPANAAGPGLGRPG